MIGLLMRLLQAFSNLFEVHEIWGIVFLLLFIKFHMSCSFFLLKFEEGFLFSWGNHWSKRTQGAAAVVPARSKTRSRTVATAEGEAVFADSNSMCQAQAETNFVLVEHFLLRKFYKGLTELWCEKNTYKWILTCPPVRLSVCKYSCRSAKTNK